MLCTIGRHLPEEPESGSGSDQAGELNQLVTQVHNPESQVKTTAAKRKVMRAQAAIRPPPSNSGSSFGAYPIRQCEAGLP